MTSTVRFRSRADDDDVYVIVDRVGDAVRLSVSIMRNGDIDVTLALDDARWLVKAMTHMSSLSGDADARNALGLGSESREFARSDAQGSVGVTACADGVELALAVREAGQDEDDVLSVVLPAGVVVRVVDAFERATAS